MRQAKKVRQLPEEQALVAAAVNALAGLVSTCLAIELLTQDGQPSRLRVGEQATFTLRAQAGWRGTVPAAGHFALGEVLVVPYVGAAQAARLRAQGTCYLDRAGNAWLQQPTHQVAVLVQGQPKPARRGRPRLLGKTGLQLVAHLLAEPALVRAPYRTLAVRVGLPFATVGRLLVSLQTQGYMVADKVRWLTRLPELRECQVAAYGELLRPRLVAGHYRWLDTGRARQGWQQLQLPPGTRWGGEPAAHLLLDGYLLPQDFTLYSAASRGELMRTLRLVPNPAGAVQVLAPPPGSELLAATRPDCVPPLMVYANL